MTDPTPPDLLDSALDAAPPPGDSIGPPGLRARLSARLEGLGRYRAGLLGVGWSGLGQVVSVVVRLASNLILTRLLVPEVYGIFSVALAFVGTMEFLSDFGVQPALIRHPEGSSRRFLLTGWSVGLSRGATLALLVVLLAYPVSRFERQPTLMPVLLALSARPLIYALRSPGVPRLRRDLDYRSLFLMEVAELAVATVVSVGVAALTHSIWSIVAGTLSGMAANLVVSYVLTPVRPALMWDREVLDQVAGLGRQIILNTMAMALWLNLDRLLGARYVPEREMGFYAVALTLATNIEMLIVRACDVYFSMLSRHADPVERRSWNRRVCLLLALAAMPALALVVAAAPAIIGLLYLPRWAPAKLLFGILTARVMARGLAQVQFEYLLATGDIRANTAAYLVAAAVQAAVLYPFVKAWGVAGLATAGLVSAVAYAVAQTIPMRLKGDVGLLPLGVTLAWMAAGLAALAIQAR